MNPVLSMSDDRLGTTRGSVKDRSMRHQCAVRGIFLALLLSCVAPPAAAQEGRRIDPEGQLVPPRVEVANQTTTISAGLYSKLPRTDLETGFLNEINDEGFLHWVLHSPTIQPFRWTTEWEDAEEGYWRLRGPGRRSSDVVLATGIVGGTGTFSIDLRDHLPPDPPTEPVIYKVDIVARTEATTTTAGNVSPTQGAAKVPAKSLGVWSVPVLISYVADNAPPTRFDIPEVYRKADFVLDKISATDLQAEIGTEEYRVAGFVQELFRTCHDEASLDCGYKIPGQHQQFGPFGKNLSPGRKTVGFGVPYRHPEQGWVTETNRWTFAMESQSGYPLARRLVVTTSVLEVDSGNELDDWTVGIKAFEDAIYIDKILEYTESELEEFLIDNAGEALRIVADGVLAFAEAAEDAVGAIPIVGQVILVIGFVIEAIIDAIPDEYCGTRSHMVTLPSLALSEVHQLPGKVEGSGAERRYVTESFEIPYACVAKGATGWDGRGDIYFHWEFHDPHTP